MTIEEYDEDVNFEKMVRSEYTTDLVLRGKHKEADDNKLMEKCMCDCSQHKTKLCFAFMLLTLPVDKLQVFASLNKLTFYISTLVSDSLLRFNDWCPNLTEIRFKRGVGMSRKAFDTFTSIHAIYPLIKTFEFDMSDNYELTRDFLAKMNVKFPSLECFDLTLSNDDEFSAYDPQYQVSYQPLYFKNLKKLSVFAFGNQVGKMFDYMAVSNAKLKDFKFMGMTTPSEMISWIGNCKNLSKLTLGCPCLTADDGLMELKNMRRLREVHLEAKNVDWDPEEMVEFARNNKRLKVMSIASDRNNNSMKFDWKFKDKFDELIRERSKLKIKVLFHEGERKIYVSESSFSETQLYETPDSEDNVSDTYRDAMFD